MAAVYLALWEAGNVRLGRRARRACRALRRFSWVFPISRPQAWLRQGQAYWLAGRPLLARHAWRRSLRAAEQLALPYEQGLAWRELGRHVPTADPTGQVSLARADAIFTRLGVRDTRGVM